MIRVVVVEFGGCTVGSVGEIEFFNSWQFGTGAL